MKIPAFDIDSVRACHFHVLWRNRCHEFFDTGKHERPHIHVKYQGEEVVIGIPDGRVIEGDIQTSKMKLVQAWIEIHRDELMANWELAINGQEVFKIEPLR